jgi:hypothetical protein
LADAFARDFVAILPAAFIATFFEAFAAGFAGADAGLGGALADPIGCGAVGPFWAFAGSVAFTGAIAAASALPFFFPAAG